MADNQQIGLELALETGSFFEGVSLYMDAISRMTEGTETAASSVTKSANVLTIAMGTAIGILTAKVAQSVAQFTNLGGAAYSLAAAASTTEGVMQGFAVTASKTGKGTQEFLDELKDASRGMIGEMQLMQQANLALTGVGADLGKEFGEALPILLKGAQMAARNTGQSFQYMFSSLVTGIKRSSPRMIDNTGIIIKMGEANQRMAASVGKSVDELDTQEKSQAVLRATLESVNTMIAEQGEMVLTAGEKFQVWRVVLSTTREEIGLRLQPALGSMIDGLMKLGAVVLPEVSDAMSMAGGSILRAVGVIADELTSLASSGVGWGQSLGYGFAEGVASAIPYIVGVIRAISDIFTQWFEPHSPPKIAPQIDQWGREMVEMYMDAFGSADLGKITTFSRELKSTLTESIAGGLLSEYEVTGMLGPLRTGFAALIDEAKKLGYVSKESLTKFASTSGALGSSVSKLTGNLLGTTAPIQPGPVSAKELSELEKAQRRFLEAVGTTDQRLEVLYDDLKNVKQGSAEYYDILVDIYGLEAQRDRELEDVAEAQFRYALAQADTAGQLDLYTKKLGKLDPATAEYYDTLTTIYGLEQQIAEERNRSSKAQSEPKTGVDKAIKEAELLAAANLRWRLATADEAEQVAILRDELSKLEPGTKEWYDMAIRLASAEDALAKKTKSGGGALDDFAKAIGNADDKLIGFPEKIANLFNPENWDIKADEIAAGLLKVLSPIRTVAPALAMLFAGDFKDALQAALFGAEAVTIGSRQVEGAEGAAPGDPSGEPQTELIKKWVPKGGDKSWEELRTELAKRIEQAIHDAMVDVTGNEMLAGFVSEHWKGILGAGLVAASPVGDFLTDLLGTIIMASVSAAIMKGALDKALKIGTGAVATGGAGAGIDTAAFVTAITFIGKLALVLGTLALAAGIAYSAWKLLTDPDFGEAAAEWARKLSESAPKYTQTALAWEALAIALENVYEATQLFVGEAGKAEVTGPDKLLLLFGPEIEKLKILGESLKWEETGLYKFLKSLQTYFDGIITWWDTTVVPFFARIAPHLARPLALETGTTTLPSLPNEEEDLEGKYGAMGESMVTGVAKGVGWSYVWDGVKGALKIGFDGVWTYLKGLLKISSPSDVYADIGVAMIEGIALGLTDFTSIITAMGDWLTAAGVKITTWMGEKLLAFTTWATITVPAWISASAASLGLGITNWLAAASLVISTWIAERVAGFTTLFTITIPNAIIGAAQLLSDAVTGVMGAMKLAADAAGNGLKRAILDPLRNAYNSAIKFLNGLPKVAGIGFNFPSWAEEVDAPEPAARGKEFWKGGQLLVGEEGPELVQLPRGSKVSTAGQTVGILEGFLDSMSQQLQSAVNLMLNKQNQMMYASVGIQERAISPSAFYRGPRESIGAGETIVNRETNVIIGPNTISGDVDLAVLEARVRRVVREETRG